MSISDKDKQYAKAILAAFYGQNIAENISINEKTVDLIGQMLEKTYTCTEAMELVPRPVSPVGAKPGVNWALKQIRKTGMRILNSSIQKISLTCKRAVAASFRGKIELSSH